MFDLFDAHTLAFVGVALVVTLTPGADTMLVVRSVLARGPRAGVATAVGIGSGLFVHATVSALGLALFLVRSAFAFEVVKTAGAIYLAYLGARSLISAVRGAPSSLSDAPDVAPPAERAAFRRAYVDGLLCNVLNPKVAVFYLAFLPQFLSAGDPVLAKSLLFAAIHFALGIAWLGAVSVGLGRVRAALLAPRVRRRLEAVSGLVLIGFGVKLALERR